MKNWGAALLLCVILGMGGCGGDAPKPTKVPMPPAEKKVGAPAKPSVQPAAEVKAEPPPVSAAYNYASQGKVNPFKPLVVEKPEAPPVKSKGVEEIPPDATPLERIDLDKLKLVAVVWNIPEPKAMVEDSAGKGYILTKGTPIGKNRGQVSRINSTGVVVTEKYESSPGNPKTREVTLKLYAD